MSRRCFSRETPLLPSGLAGTDGFQQVISCLQDIIENRGGVPGLLFCAFAPGGPRAGRGPWETRAFVVDSVPHYPNKIEQFTRGGEVVRQNLRARLHGDAPWRRELRYRLVRGGG